MTEINKEYAEALFLLACEQGEEQAYMAALETVTEAMREQPAFSELLSSPSIPLGERQETLSQVFGTRVPEYVLSFLQLLCEKGRIRELERCAEEYRRLLLERASVVTARVTSAVALTEEERQALRAKLEKMSGSTVEPDYLVDPSLLGGVVVEMNGTVIDGSLRHRLREVKDVMNR